MASTTVDASGIDVYVLLREMWAQAPVASFFAASGMSPPPLDDSELAHLFDDGNDHVDYLAGRPIKTSFRDMAALNPAGFDRDCGGYDSHNTGALARIVEKLRAK